MTLRAALLLALSTALLSGCPTTTGGDDDDAVCDPARGDERPVVVIDDPVNTLLLEDGDPINWVVRVTDGDSDVQDIVLEALDMSSGAPQPIDVDLPGPGADGRAVFSMSTDEVGTGVVTVRILATDSIGCEGNDQVVLCIDAEAECPN